jgi:hypothetical protein
MSDVPWGMVQAQRFPVSMPGALRLQSARLMFAEVLRQYFAGRRRWSWYRSKHRNVRP